MMPSSSSLSFSSIIKRRWDNQNVPPLFYSLLAGFIGHVYLNYRKRNEHWYKVDRMYNDHLKRSEELSKRFDRYFREDYEDPKPSS